MSTDLTPPVMKPHENSEQFKSEGGTHVKLKCIVRSDSRDILFTFISDVPLSSEDMHPDQKQPLHLLMEILCACALQPETSAFQRMLNPSTGSSYRYNHVSKQGVDIKPKFLKPLAKIIL